MRRLGLVVTLALIWAVASNGLARQTKAAQPPSEKQAAATKAKAQADGPTPAQLQAKIYRSMAALFEARSAKKPDQEKIEKLTKQLQNLRQQMWGQAAAVRGGPVGPWQCPWGGPGMGFGYGRGAGPAMGPGRGRGMGGRGGWGMGAGRGPAMGGRGGWGMGAGRGPAMGGRGGWGMGAGRGAAMGGRGGWGMGAGRGPAMGPRGGRGLGRQWGFIDRDGDGVCDNFR